MALASLLEFMALLEIEGNAVRTALSRLVKDGVLERQKHGRHTSYRLVKQEEERFARASKKIYADGAGQWNGEFDLLLLPEAAATSKLGNRIRSDFRQTGFGSPMQGVFIRPAGDALLPKAVTQHNPVCFRAKTVDEEPVGMMVQKSWQLDALNKEYGELLRYFSSIASETVLHASNEEALGLRVLLIHLWRRLILKDVDLPADLKGEGWQGEIARARIAQLYGLVLSKSETCLDSFEATPGNALPTPTDDLRSRFNV